MAKSEYEGYTSKKATVLLREKFGSASVYNRKAQSILTKATGYIGSYDFTLNPYRGCQYGCSYCYAAAFSPNPRMRRDWGKWVLVKENAAQQLEKELGKWFDKNPDTPPSIYMSSVTDPYQPIEAQDKLTRRLLEVMVAYQPTLVIQTRSPMVVRDLDLLQQLERLRVNISIPTGSEKVRRDFEPHTPSIVARFQAAEKLRYGIDMLQGYVPKISITITPLLPTLREDEPAFMRRLQVADRVVVQQFHASKNQSLVAVTRQEAEAIKRRYAWWFDRENECYAGFKSRLFDRLEGIVDDIQEGRQGFGYE
jgi:DNA repair photolyase